MVDQAILRRLNPTTTPQELIAAIHNEWPVFRMKASTTYFFQSHGELIHCFRTKEHIYIPVLGQTKQTNMLETFIIKQ